MNGTTFAAPTRWLVTIASLTLGLILSPSPAAAYCPGGDKNWSGYSPNYYSLGNEFRRSTIVAVVRVEREIWLGEDGKPKPLRPPFMYGNPRPWGFDPYIGAYYDVKIIRSFKGKAHGVIRVFSDNSTARFWLVVGREYVILAGHGKFEPPIGTSLTLDTCGNSPRPLKKSRGLLRELDRLAARRS